MGFRSNAENWGSLVYLRRGKDLEEDHSASDLLMTTTLRWCALRCSAHAAHGQHSTARGVRARDSAALASLLKDRRPAYSDLPAEERRRKSPAARGWPLRSIGAEPSAS